MRVGIIRTGDAGACDRRHTTVCSGVYAGLDRRLVGAVFPSRRLDPNCCDWRRIAVEARLGIETDESRRTALALLKMSGSPCRGRVSNGASRMQAFGLHPDFGVEVRHADLRTVTADHLYPEIRELFEQHSLLLFRDQDLDEPAHRALAELFGPLEDLRDPEPGMPPPRPMVSNVATAGGLTDDSELRLLDLKSDFFWRTDSTFLPPPAISNILVGYTIPSSGGNTEFVSTRVGWAHLTDD